MGEPSRMGMSREKTSGQKKARAAARTRARMLISRVQDGVSDPWAGLSNDARALTALLEFAATRNPGAEEALAGGPKTVNYSRTGEGMGLSAATPCKISKSPAWGRTRYLLANAYDFLCLLGVSRTVCEK